MALSTVFTSLSTTSSSTSLSRFLEDIILLKPLLLSSMNLSLEITLSIIPKIRLLFSKTSESDLPAIFLVSGSESDNKFKISASVSDLFLKGKRNAADVGAPERLEEAKPEGGFLGWVDKMLSR